MLPTTDERPERASLEQPAEVCIRTAVIADVPLLTASTVRRERHMLPRSQHQVTGLRHAVAQVDGEVMAAGAAHYHGDL